MKRIILAIALVLVCLSVYAAPILYTYLTTTPNSGSPVNGSTIEYMNGQWIFVPYGAGGAGPFNQGQFDSIGGQTNISAGVPLTNALLNAPVLTNTMTGTEGSKILISTLSNAPIEMLSNRIEMDYLTDRVGLNYFNLVATNSGTETVDIEFDNGTEFLSGTMTIGSGGNLDLLPVPALSVLYNNGSQVVQGVSLTGTNTLYLDATGHFSTPAGGSSSIYNQTNFTTNANLQITATNTGYDVYWFTNGAGQDDTANWQKICSLITNTTVNAGVSVNVYMQRALYTIGGSIVGSGTFDSQVYLPTVQSAQQAILSFHGYNSTPSSGGSTNLPGGTNNTIIRCTLTGGTWPDALIASAHGGNNNVHVVMDNIVFRMPSNPSLSCLNFGDQNDVELKNVYITEEATPYTGANLAAPTHTNAIGIILPQVDNPNMVTLDRVYVYGMYYGIETGELLKADTIMCAFCGGAGLWVSTNIFANHIVSYNDFANGVGIQAVSNGVAFMSIDDWEIAWGSPAQTWMTRTNDIQDGKSLIAIDAKFHKPTFQGLVTLTNQGYSPGTRIDIGNPLDFIPTFLTPSNAVLVISGQPTTTSFAAAWSLFNFQFPWTVNAGSNASAYVTYNFTGLGTNVACATTVGGTFLITNASGTVGCLASCSNNPTASGVNVPSPTGYFEYCGATGVTNVFTTSVTNNTTWNTVATVIFNLH